MGLRSKTWPSAPQFRERWIVDRKEDGYDEQGDLHALFAGAAKCDRY